jgi:hypothetical protein
MMRIEGLAAKEVAMAPGVGLGAAVKEVVFRRQLRVRVGPDELI